MCACADKQTDIENECSDKPADRQTYKDPLVYELLAVMWLLTGKGPHSDVKRPAEDLVLGGGCHGDSLVSRGALVYHGRGIT